MCSAGVTALGKWAVKCSRWLMSHQLHVSGQSNPAELIFQRHF